MKQKLFLRLLASGVTITGGALALHGSVTVGAVASFLSLNKSFNMPISQVAQQFNSIIMALAGAERIFAKSPQRYLTDRSCTIRQDEGADR